MTIKEIRALTGMTQKQFAEKYHITFSSIRNWESGHRTCLDYVAELLEFKVREDLNMDKMIAYKLKDVSDFPNNCKECVCHWCRLPLKDNKYEPEVKKTYWNKRHEECPLINVAKHYTGKGERE